MPRRRKKKPDPFDLVIELLGPVAALIFLLAFFAPSVLQLIFGLIVTLGIIILCCGAVFLIVRFIIRSRAKHPEPTVRTATPRRMSEWGADDESIQFNDSPLAHLELTEADKEELEPTLSKSQRHSSIEERLKAIDWFQFEKVVSVIYEVRGCSVKRLGGAKPDGGIDLIVEKDGERLVIQCKHWRKWNVGVRHIRELLGALVDSKIEKGVLVTLRGCTPEATELANKHGIHIVDQKELVALMQMADGSLDKRIVALLDDTRKFCPRCERPLRLRTATKGFNRGEQFWGCSNFPRCRYILRNP